MTKHEREPAAARPTGLSPVEAAIVFAMREAARLRAEERAARREQRRQATVEGDGHG